MSKISELSDGGSLTSTDYLIAVRSGGNVKVRMDQINVDQVDLGDNEFIRLGNSQDLTMVHTSTQSIINQAGIGDLLIQKAGATKLTINASGIDVTGTVTADGGLIEGSTGLTIRNDAVGANEPKLVFDNDTFAGATYGQIQTGNGGLQLLIESPSTSTFQNRHQLVLNGGGSTDVTFKLSTDNGTSYKNQLQINNNDISFYEDTGTTPKFFWDASAEALGIGTSSPVSKLNTVLVQADNGSASDTTLANSFHHLGGGEYGIGRYYLTTYGYSTSQTNSGAYIGALSMSSTGSAKYDLVFGTRNVTTDTAPTERMRIDASGLVTVGSAVASTNVEFRLNGVASKAQRIRFAESGVDKWLIGQGASSETDAFEIYNSNGQMSLSIAKATSAATFSGIVTANGLFASNASGGNVASFTNTTDADLSINLASGVSLITPSTGILAFGTSSAERMRLDANGHLVLGNTVAQAQGVTIYGNGTNGLYSATSSTSAYWITNLGLTSATGTLFSFYNNATACGNITITSTNVTNYASVSDERLKENIADADDAGSKIDAIQVRKFDWKSGGEHQDYGFIAQELLEVAPVAVSVPEDPEEMMSVDPAKLVPMMLKEIQSLRARVAQLES